jgi:hypothetical protein
MEREAKRIYGVEAIVCGGLHWRYEENVRIVEVKLAMMISFGFDGGK